MSDQLQAALALVKFGPAAHNPRPQDWIHLANAMLAYCSDGETVTYAAARILAEYVAALEEVCDSDQLARAQASISL